MDTSKISNLQFEDIHTNEYPDFSSAWVSNADYDGEPMTIDQLEELNNDYGDFIYEKLLNHIF